MSPQRSFLLGGTLTLLLAACSQPQMQQPAEVDPYANGASYPWSYVAPEGKLTSLTLTPGENTLQYEPVLAARNGWGPIEVNRSNGERGAGDGKTLSINGKTYSRGFGTHAGSELRFSLQGTGATCNRFTADVGVDDEVGSRGKVVFQVFLDGVKAYDSGAVEGKDPAKRVDLDITGKGELRLVVTDAGNGISYDHADWADPKIYCQAVQTPPAGGKPGTLDLSFGSNGTIPYGGVAAALETDGSLLFVKTVNGNFALRRYTPNGETRQVTTDLGGQDVPTSLAVQADGRIVVVGTSRDNVVVTRYNRDLSLDVSFGAGGTVITDLGGTGGGRSLEPHNDLANDVAVQPDGKLVVVGSVAQAITQYGDIDPNRSSFNFVLLRYTPDGRLDPSFGTGGKVITNLPRGSIAIYFSDDILKRVALQSDGKIVAAGEIYCGSDYAGALVRYNADGSVDPNFLGNEVITQPSESGCGRFNYNDMALAPGGKIVTGGWTGRFRGEATVNVRDSDGSYDKTVAFGFRELRADLQYEVQSVVVQSDGKIVAAGNGMARFNTDLSFDTTFGEAGTGIVQAGASTLLLQPDGKIVAVSGDSTQRYWP